MVFVNDGVKEAGTFLARSLEQHIPQLYEKKYPRLWAEEGMYLPAVGDLEEGAREVIETTVNQVGEALISADGADDVPLVDVSMDEFPFKATCISAGIKYSIPELKAAMRANQDIKTTRLNGLGKALAERIHKLAVFGSSKHGMNGFFAHPRINLVNSSYDADGSGVTAQDHIDFISDNLIKVESDSNLTEGIETILVPAKLYNVWAKTILPSTNQNIIRHVLENFGTEAGGTLRQIKKVNECQSSYLEKYKAQASGTNKDRVVFMPFDPMAFERKYYPVNFLEPQLQGMSYTLVAYTGTSEVIDHYPGSALYVDIPKL